jgi:hypothetical protein
VHQVGFYYTDISRCTVNKTYNLTSGVPRNFFGGGGGQPRNFFGGATNSVEDRGQRERGSEGGSPLVRGSGASYNLVQEISYHIIKFS